MIVQDQTPEFDCPTLHHLHVDPHSIEGASPLEVTNAWFSAFKASISTGDLDALVSLFHKHGFWKDILALTWDMRTVRGHPAIRRVLDARLAATGLTACHLIQDAVRDPTTIKPIPDVAFVRFCFEFETVHGQGVAVAFLVPTPERTWKAWSLLTRLSSLKDHPEKIGEWRPRPADHANPQERRRREIDFDNDDPTVLVIGAGHCGLSMAARLTYLGVPTLVVDRNRRIGDNWRMRHSLLSLHNPVWYHHMPYLDFPKTWPVYCPGSKLGDWLESYATALDLNVWLSSSITSTRFDREGRSWKVSVDRDGQTRTMTVKHLVFATGFGGGLPKMPDIAGKELYRGLVLHSTQCTSATGYEGRKVLVVGACTSAHDIAHDLCRHGCDVTIIQRSPTYVLSRAALEMALGEMYNDHFPIEFADLLTVALPFATLKCLKRVSVARTANGIDKDLLDGLAKAGFRTYLGPDGAGLLPLVFDRNSGFYVDTGASQEIINGTIKVKATSNIRRFTEVGVELDDKTILEGDAIIFATGFGDIRGSIEEVCGSDVVAKVGVVSGLDAEGELQGIWRRTGHPGLWVAMANFARSRLHSLHLALQIKAIEEGIIQEEDIYAGRAGLDL